MADYGAFFRADDGSLLVTSDTPCYEYVGEFSPSSRSGNVNTYSVNTATFPVVFVKCGVGNSGGILAIQGSSGAWTVSVLSSISCPIQVFTPINSASTSGYGMVAYDSSGRAVFDSSKKLLNARNVRSLSEGVSFATNDVVDMVSYTCGPVKPNVSTSQQWVVIDSYMYTDMVYSCSYSIQYVCHDQNVYVCTPTYQCTPSFTCGVDYTGNFSCGYVDSCGIVSVCGYQWQSVCGYENVQTCGYTQIFNYAEIDGLVKTTTWSIERGVARINSNKTVSFDWILHKNGYYKEIIQYNTYGFASALTGGLPPGYVPGYLMIAPYQGFEGELTKDNTFPYTTSRANQGALSCITAIRSDYD
jgi:hypothetical protein